ncbi:MAG: T9SS type A sorting domain-containing protein, partial [Bacteroidota bacterium]
NGAMTFKTTGGFSMTGGNFTGQLLPINLSIDTLSIGGSFLFNSATPTNYLKTNCGSGPTVLATTGNFTMQNSGTAIGQGVYGVYGDKSQTGSLIMTVGLQYSQINGRFNGIYDGAGNMTFTSTNQPFLMSGGDFRGIYNPDTTNAGNTTFSLKDMNFSGGIWMMHYGVNTLSAATTITFTGNCAINFGAATDQFMFVGLPYVAPANNTLLLTATIGGYLSITGTTGTFVSSKSGGDETINITGNFDIGGGNNSFNIVQNSGFAFGHGVTLNLSGNLTVSGGTTFLSAEYGTATATVIGNMSMTGGTFSIKGAGGFAAHNFNVNGNFIQSAGTFYLHNNALTSTNAAVNVTFNSDFTQSGGTIMFDMNASGASASHVINVKGANYNISGGNITSASPGTGAILGQINFNRTGTINYNRTGNHDVQQARQYVLSGTTLIVNTGNLQVASYFNNTLTDIFSVQFGGILDLKTNQIFSNATQPNSIVEVRSTGRVRLQNINGLFDNTNLAAINNVGNMNYNLSGGSVVEYYGVASQVLTGIGLGIATLPQHKYGILDINLPAGAQYVHVSTGIDSVFVRSQLNMRAGELSLDNDHVTSNGGGKAVTIESPITTAISYVTTAPGSYIRSETEDGSAKLKWKMGSITGIHKVLFGASSLQTDTIPCSYAPMAATATGDVTFATYHTVPSNLPYPPTVTQLNNALTGNPDFAQTVDRFWNITVSGATPPVPNITFYCTAAEAAGVSQPLRAQKWMFPVQSWSYPVPGVSQNNPTLYSAQVVSSAVQTGWWTLSSQANPLPVEFLDFSVKCDGKDMKVFWNTASQTNNDHFTIERSADGNKFELLTIVKGAGNSSSANKYEVVDRSPLKGISYYRLSQTDFNGHTEVFKITSCRSCLADDGELQLVVTPDIETGTSLFITSPSNEDFVIDVFDAAGNRVLTQKNSVKEGFNNVNLKTNNLSSGIYIVKLIGNSHNLSQRFFISGNQ